MNEKSTLLFLTAIVYAGLAASLLPLTPLAPASAAGTVASQSIIAPGEAVTAPPVALGAHPHHHGHRHAPPAVVNRA